MTPGEENLRRQLLETRIRATFGLTYYGTLLVMTLLLCLAFYLLERI